MNRVSKNRTLFSVLIFFIEMTASKRIGPEHNPSNGPLKSILISRYAAKNSQLAMIPAENVLMMQSSPETLSVTSSMVNNGSNPANEPLKQDSVIVYAIQTFAGNAEGQVCVLRGDTLQLLDDSNSYWWLVRTIKTGEIGYIPAENIEVRSSCFIVIRN